MTEIHSPFFDTRDTRKLDLAGNLLSYPYEFCCREKSRQLLLALSPENVALALLIRSLQSAQERLSQHLPLAGCRDIWINREDHLGSLGIETIPAAPASCLKDGHWRKLHHALNLQILEQSLDTIPSIHEGAISEETLRLAAACIWMSEHLALVALGIASVSFDEPNSSIRIAPASESARINLRRVWFGAALEEASLDAASFVLQAFADAILHRDEFVGDIWELHAQALSIFPQHWRLPVGSGPVAQLLDEWLRPLLRLIANAIAIAGKSGPPQPIKQAHAESIGAGAAFLHVRDMTIKAGLTDRLFDVVDGGLVLGSRSLGPGAIAIAESIAETVIGENWHNKDSVSDAQMQYVMERISRSSHAKVLNFELRMSDTTHNTPIDVDFMVRDLVHGKIHAIQLKHLEASDKGGLLYWISRFRRRERGLGKAVAQLDQLTDLIKVDAKVKAKLTREGIGPEEFDSIVPIVIHNLGRIDFWVAQSGVLLYDTGTYCNVLDGLSATCFGLADGQYISRAREGNAPSGPSLHRPDSVIDAFVRDPVHARLSDFDLAAGTSRALEIGDKRFVAIGLGI